MVILFLSFSVLFNYIFESERRVQGSENLKGNIAFLLAFANKHTHNKLHTQAQFRRRFVHCNLIKAFQHHFSWIFFFEKMMKKKRVKNAKTFDLNEAKIFNIDQFVAFNDRMNFAENFQTFFFFLFCFGIADSFSLLIEKYFLTRFNDWCAAAEKSQKHQKSLSGVDIW